MCLIWVPLYIIQGLPRYPPVPVGHLHQHPLLPTPCVIRAIPCVNYMTIIFYRVGDYVPKHVAPPHEKKGLCLKDRNLSKFSTKMCLQYSITNHFLLLHLILYVAPRRVSSFIVNILFATSIIASTPVFESSLTVVSNKLFSFGFSLLILCVESLSSFSMRPFFLIAEPWCYLLILSSFGVAEVDVLQLSSSTVIRCRMCLREFFEVDCFYLKNILSPNNKIIELGDVKVLSLTLVDHV
ncbi:hypothetical protein AGLY_016598 [Aphis glycines]|uniref:Uncharacterized protein n=1 Tax=Aphis glycines TaxID=307491 RepID=A0A6G0SZ85_APHGL|nr:hypothetical protein AGLY_016598 [Aphis glycines]